MRFVDAAGIDAIIAYPALVDALAAAFRAGTVAPVRHHHTIEREGETATLLLMPAWDAAGDGFIGVKIASVFPLNAGRAKPSVMGTYLLLTGDSGAPLAGFDGMALTLWRTAAASALAARALARPDAGRLAMIGAGALAPRLIAAHAAVRPIAEVTVWNRTPEAAERLAARLTRPSLRVTATRDRRAAVAEADIVSVATMSSDPVVEGAWLKPGTHLDLVGAYTPRMREADDEAVRRARVYVDTRGGALKEAGDIVQPIAAGVIGEADIAGDLFDLCRGAASGRRSAEEITVFKSVGSAIEDLAAAVLVGGGCAAEARQAVPPAGSAASSGGLPATVGLVSRFVPNRAPMTLIVKICGLSTEATVDAALAAGADMIGLNFFPRSPRFVAPARAAELARRVAGRAEIVALGVDMDDAAIAEIVAVVSPDWLQLHGQETPERVAEVASRFGRPVMKALAVATAEDLARAAPYMAVADSLLLDAKAPKDATRPGGNGVPFDWSLLSGFEPDIPYMLSGGLTPGNVAEAVALTGAPGVDVSSGVESAPGRKEADLIRAFIANARGAGAAPLSHRAAS